MTSKWVYIDDENNGPKRRREICGWAFPHVTKSGSGWKLCTNKIGGNCHSSGNELWRIDEEHRPTEFATMPNLNEPGIIRGIDGKTYVYRNVCTEVECDTEVGLNGARCNPHNLRHKRQNEPKPKRRLKISIKSGNNDDEWQWQWFTWTGQSYGRDITRCQEGQQQYSRTRFELWFQYHGLQNQQCSEQEPRKACGKE